MIKILGKAEPTVDEACWIYTTRTKLRSVSCILLFFRTTDERISRRLGQEPFVPINHSSTTKNVRPRLAMK